MLEDEGYRAHAHMISLQQLYRLVMQDGILENPIGLVILALMTSLGCSWPSQLATADDTFDYHRSHQSKIIIKSL